MASELAQTDEQKELAALLKRVNTDKPKPEDVKAFRELLSKDDSLWRMAGDMGITALEKLIGSIKGTALVKESVCRGVDKLRDDLGYQTASGIERTLIDQVVLCQLHLNLVDMQYTEATSGDIYRELRDSWEHRLSATQRRYLRAVETLARVRRLLRLPTVQVNIGAQQVNVAGDVKRG